MILLRRKAERAAFLRAMLRPERLLDDLENRATRCNRPHVVLIGVKGSSSEWTEVREVVGPRFRREIEDDPEITSMLNAFREIGFDIDWGGYSDPTGEEFDLRIYRDEEAERRLKATIEP